METIWFDNGFYKGGKGRERTGEEKREGSTQAVLGTENGSTALGSWDLSPHLRTDEKSQGLGLEVNR